MQNSKGKILRLDELNGLIILIEKSKIITDKNTDATTNILKAKEWQHIAHVFNATYGVCRRTPHQLRLKWDNLKKSSRKRSAQIRMSRNKNGELPDDFPSNAILDRVAAILGNPVDIKGLKSKKQIKKEETSDEECIETENDTMQIDNDKQTNNPTTNMNSRNLAMAQFYVTKKHLVRSKAQNVKLESEKINLEHEKIKLENEKIMLEQEKIRLENEKIILEHENLRLQNVKLLLEISKLKGEDV